MFFCNSYCRCLLATPCCQTLLQLPHRAMRPHGMTCWPPSWLQCGSAAGCTARDEGTPAATKSRHDMIRLFLLACFFCWMLPLSQGVQQLSGWLDAHLHAVARSIATAASVTCSTKPGRCCCAAATAAAAADHDGCCCCCTPACVSP
jgi:hypothetical protein